MSYETEQMTDEDMQDIEQSLDDLKAKKFKTIEQYAADEGIPLN